MVICPGSRSAPLVYAFTRNKAFTCYSATDERSAAFIALGLSQQTQLPVVLICTSGTACLNFFPAVAEAFYQKIPLIVLSADRPPELLNQQDGQMIMQKGVFGKHVKASHEVLCFEEDKIDYHLTERIIQTAFEEAVNHGNKGPVHVNVPLREPLYNISLEIQVPKLQAEEPLKPMPGATALPLFSLLTEAWKSSTKRLIILGQWPGNYELTLLLQQIAQQNDVVILSDICANQAGLSVAPNFDYLLKHLPTEELEELEPDFILSLGGPMLSKSLKQWLSKQKPAWHYRLQQGADPIDTWQNMTHLLQAPEMPYLKALKAIKAPAHEYTTSYVSRWEFFAKKALKKLSQVIPVLPWCEPKAVHLLMHLLPEQTHLQLGNSAAIRWVSWAQKPGQAIFQIDANRGTSGIDGSMSTGVGAALANPNELTLLILGDLSFFYDEHALWFEPIPNNLKIVVLCNGGGNIFNWIDGPSKHPEELPYFVTPHNRKVEAVAQQYGIPTQTCAQEADLASNMKWLMTQPTAAVLCLQFNKPENLNGIHVFNKI